MRVGRSKLAGERGPGAGTLSEGLGFRKCLTFVYAQELQLLSLSTVFQVIIRYVGALAWSGGTLLAYMARVQTHDCHRFHIFWHCRVSAEFRIAAKHAAK